MGTLKTMLALAAAADMPRGELLMRDAFFGLLCVYEITTTGFSGVFGPKILRSNYISHCPTFNPTHAITA